MNHEILTHLGLKLWKANGFKKVGRVLVYIHVTGYDVDDHFKDENFTAGCVSPKAKKKENGKEKVEEFIDCKTI